MRSAKQTSFPLTLLFLHEPLYQLMFSSTYCRLSTFLHIDIVIKPLTHLATLHTFQLQALERDIE